MIDNGMVQVSLPELKEMVGELNYKILKDFDYTNTLNENSYYARSYAIIDKDTGHSFANVDSNKENLPELQKIRRNYFCVVDGRISEL